MRCPFRPISIRPRLEISFEDRLQDELHRSLNHTITDRRNRQDPNFLAPIFRNLLLPIRYASRSVSILQTWTYSPQKRQAGSAFAWTYRLLLRSCRLMDAFVISPLPSMLLESLQTARSLRSIRITRLRRYCGPLRHPLAFHRLPGVAGYTVSFSADFATGRGGLLQLLSASLPSCCCCNPARVPRRFSQFATSHVTFAP